MSGMRNRDC